MTDTTLIKYNNLQYLLDKQYELGKQFTAFHNLNDLEREKALIEFIGHTIEELNEVRQELPIRKHWRKKNLSLPDWSKVKEELMDVLHFYLTMCLIVDMDANEICALYMKKNKINHQRQKEDY